MVCASENWAQPPAFGALVLLRVLLLVLHEALDRVVLWLVAAKLQLVLGGIGISPSSISESWPERALMVFVEWCFTVMFSSKYTQDIN